MKIGLCAVRARELAISVLCRNRSILGGTGAECSHRRSARSTWEDASSTLRAHDMGRRVGQVQGVAVEGDGGLQVRMLHAVVPSQGWNGGHRAEWDESAVGPRCHGDRRHGL
jgi:hypothetical protein